MILIFVTRISRFFPFFQPILGSTERLGLVEPQTRGLHLFSLCFV